MVEWSGLGGVLLIVIGGSRQPNNGLLILPKNWGGVRVDDVSKRRGEVQVERLGNATRVSGAQVW